METKGTKFEHENRKIDQWHLKKCNWSSTRAVP